MKVEKWICENGNKEFHYYNKGDETTYIVGFSGKYCSKKLMKKVLKMIKKENAKSL
jgi:hypothetical protein